MYNEEKWYEKDPSKMTEEEAKQAVAYYYGRCKSEIDDGYYARELARLLLRIEEIEADLK